MHSIQKCHCSVRALELFVRDFGGGVEVRSRSVRPFLLLHGQHRNTTSSSNFRQFGTASALRLRQSTAACSSVVSTLVQAESTAAPVDEALEAVSAPEQSSAQLDIGLEDLSKNGLAVEFELRESHTASALPSVPLETEPLLPSVPTARLDILPPSRSRVDGRKERKVKRKEESKRQDNEAKRQVEEAKAAAVLEKKRRRREDKRNGSPTASSLQTSITRSTFASEPRQTDDSNMQTTDGPVITTLTKWQRKKAKARLAAAAAAAAEEAAGQQVEDQTTPKPRRDRSRQVRSERGDSTQQILAATQESSQVVGDNMAKVAVQANSEQDKGVSDKNAAGTVRAGAGKKEAILETNENEGQEWEDRRETWMKQKAALNDKFGEQKWNPRKRISPDALAGIRTLHAQQPDVYSTEILADHFKISPEAVRRILRSKWQPDEEAVEERRKRWEKRGQKKWEEMVEQGIRPPKKWREMGVGRAEAGDVPAWKKKGGRKGGERWIEHPEMDSFIAAGDMAAEASSEPSIGDRIV